MAERLPTLFLFLFNNRFLSCTGANAIFSRGFMAISLFLAPQGWLRRCRQSENRAGSGQNALASQALAYDDGDDDEAKEEDI